MKFVIRNFCETPITTAFRYQGKWYFASSNGSIFRYITEQASIFAGITIEDDEPVGVAVNE